MKEDNHDPIRWDQNKKRLRDEQIAKADQDEKKRKAMLLVSNLYERWKKSFTRTKKTHEQIMDALDDLKDQCHKAVKDAAPEWLAFTDKMISEKIGMVLAGLTAKKNDIEEVLPTYAKMLSPSKATITTKEEFESLPFVKRVKEKDGFVGFLRDGPRIVAMFDEGEPLVVATASTHVGLLDYPTLSEYRSEFAKNQRKN